VPTCACLRFSILGSVVTCRGGCARPSENGGRIKSRIADNRSTRNSADTRLDVADSRIAQGGPSSAASSEWQTLLPSEPKCRRAARCTSPTESPRTAAGAVKLPISSAALGRRISLLQDLESQLLPRPWLHLFVSSRHLSAPISARLRVLLAKREVPCSHRRFFRESLRRMRLLSRIRWRQSSLAPPAADSPELRNEDLRATLAKGRRWSC
jgi:hypothetical protein